MKANELMSKPLIWASIHDSIHDVAEVLRVKHISGVPVRDEFGTVMGVFTQTDLAFYNSRHIGLLVEEKVHPTERKEHHMRPEQDKVEGWITPRIYTVSQEASLINVIKELLRRKVRRVFVRAKDSNAIIGVITVTDVLKHLIKKPFQMKKLHLGAPRVLELAFLILALPFFVAVCSAAPLTVDPTASQIWLTGTSTLHPFASTSTLTQVLAELSSDAVDAQDIARRGAVSHFDVAIPVNGLKSGESGLDKNLYKALKIDQAPEIHFKLTHYQATAATADGSIPFQASGILSIAGNHKDVTISGSGKPADNGLLMEGTYKLLMSDYGVKPPTLMFGAIKVGDPVVIHFHLKFVIKKGGLQ